MINTAINVSKNKNPSTKNPRPVGCQFFLEIRNKFDDWTRFTDDQKVIKTGGLLTKNSLQGQVIVQVIRNIGSISASISAILD
jgi:hypothetical protein